MKKTNTNQKKIPDNYQLVFLFFVFLVSPFKKKQPTKINIVMSIILIDIHHSKNQKFKTPKRLAAASSQGYSTILTVDLQGSGVPELMGNP